MMAPQETNSEKQARLFRTFLQKRKIMIVDPESFSRAALAQVLIELGSSTQQIKLVSNYAEAQAAIIAACPDIVLSEFDLDRGHCGIDLLAGVRKTQAGTGQALFIVVTGNTSQAAVARAAEEDVDGYLLKPYTADGIRLALVKYGIEKINPSEYQKKIQEGKRKLDEKEMDAAMALFRDAQKLDPKPALACFYQGFTEEQKKTVNEAEKDYDKGLGFNHIHYKCLLAQFDLYTSQSRHKDAYAIAQKLARYFPASPERLSTVLKLAVLNEAFEDIERYYRLFCKLDHRNDLLVRYVCAALIVCGKYFLQQQKMHRALELFEKAKATSARNPRFLREIALSLIGVGQAERAWPFVEAFPPEAQSSADYRALRYAATEGRLPLGVSIAEGRKLLTEGVKEYVVYTTLIRRSIEAGFAEHADQLSREALKLWPEKEGEIRRIQRESTLPKTA
jgi:CheY-like chemotaxis protein